MGFVTDAGWIDGNAMDGMRACLKDEFSSLYIFHLIPTALVVDRFGPLSGSD